jgi:hypothetical protein
MQDHIDTNRSETKRRRIGLLREGIKHCPEVPGWTGKNLLDEARLTAGKTYPRRDPKEPVFLSRPSEIKIKIEAKDPGEALLESLGLDRYCIYDQEKGAKGELPLKPELLEAEPDRMALSTTSAGGNPSDAIGRKIWKTLAEQFVLQTGQTPSGLASSFLLEELPNVRLAFLDSEPTNEGVPSRPPVGESLHGFTLARLAQDIVCPSGGSCAAKIVTRRALGYKSFDQDKSLPSQELPGHQSGHMGLVSDLATAIVAEVLRWQEVEPEKKLILNLSLGWDAEAFGDLDVRQVSRLEPSVQAVYKAIQFARRSGVLVIAAAGNSRGGNDISHWPLLPAAWELRRPSFFRFLLGRKPVYAVGGADWQGLPLPNARNGGRPRRVTYADHSVTQAENGIEPTAMYTGTSVSAAVASSIAAVVWHLRPELSPAQVMRLMAKSGEQVKSSRADFYAWKKLWPLSKLLPAPHVRQLSLRGAIQKACEGDSRRCSTLAPEENTPFPPNLAPILAELPGSVDPAGPPVPQMKYLVDVTSQRWVVPQPEATPCPDCTLVAKPPPARLSAAVQEYELVLQIGSAWQEEAAQEELSIESATIEIEGFVGDSAKTLIYQIPPAMLKPPIPPTLPPVYRLSGMGSGMPLEGTKARILFRVINKQSEAMSILNPVVIGR